MALLGDVKGLRILDAGWGPRLCSEQLARRVAFVHAFHITPQMVDVARHRCAGLPVEVATGDLACPLDWLLDQSFDKI
jgi:2-polyprenyl-3-methyl-5-hydroxy-6-metoxy-1,4-benzoquinol methylase